MRTAELKLIGLLEDEVKRKRADLVKKCELKWSALEVEEDEDYKEFLWREVEEKGRRLKKCLKERRMKWTNKGNRRGTG